MMAPTCSPKHSWCFLLTSMRQSPRWTSGMPKHRNKNKLLHLPLNLERSRMTTYLALLAQSSQKPPESPSKTTRKVQARAATKERGRTTAKGLTLAGKWEWKNHVPSGNDPKHKKFKGTDYYWCLMHKAWINHHPNKCRKKEHLEAQGEEGSNDNSNNNQSKGASYANVLNAIIMDITNSQEWLFLGLCLTLLRIMAKMPIITARFLWAFPSMLSQFLINLFIITALTTVMIVLVSKGILQVSKPQAQS